MRGVWPRGCHRRARCGHHRFCHRARRRHRGRPYRAVRRNRRARRSVAQGRPPHAVRAGRLARSAFPERTRQGAVRHAGRTRAALGGTRAFAAEKSRRYNSKVYPERGGRTPAPFCISNNARGRHAVRARPGATRRRPLRPENRTNRSMHVPDFPPAILALADGTVFRGVGIGATGASVGEVVFNTAMSGYQEILTDPSYCRQIVTLTYPHIGNTGVNREDCEASRVHAAGLVIRDLPLLASSFRMEQTLDGYLKAERVVAIAGIDTRKLTRILRERGAQAGCLMAGEIDEAAAIARARAFPGLSGMDLAKVVSTDKPYAWNEGEWKLGSGYATPGSAHFHVVAYDFGIKRNILRMLASRGCRVTVVPAQTPAAEALALNPDGIFLSNGPGDPEPCDYAIAAIREFLARGIPTFGICLGHQLMGLASGARTTKMKFGHHGGNHPVKDLQSGQVLITSQNHCFAVDIETLPANARVTHVSLFDGTLQGFARTDVPAFCFQGHPEASPGPHDLGYLFDRFIKLMETDKSKKAQNA